MIDIVELSGKTLKDIREIIEAEKTTEYEIYVPKSGQLHFTENSNVAYDYGYAAYTGQLLADIAENFEYDSVPPQDFESIGFTVKVHEKDLLAKTILEISYLYVNDRDEEDYLDIEDVNEYMDKVESKEIIPACPDFAEYFFEYIEEKEEED